MSVFAEPKIDCHAHVLDPVNFPYGEDIARAFEDAWPFVRAPVDAFTLDHPRSIIACERLK